MTSKGFGIAIVVDDDGKIFGVVTDGDLRRNMEGLMERRAGEIATRDPELC
jgi:arabinose-5-phosphate isomerase